MRIQSFTLLNFSHFSCLVAGSTLVIASAITPALGNPIPPTTPPSALEGRQEASIQEHPLAFPLQRGTGGGLKREESKIQNEVLPSSPNREQPISSVSGEDEGEVRETSAKKLPHPTPASCRLRHPREEGEMAALPSQGEEGDSSLSEQSCLPILQKISTSAADLVPDELDPPPSPLAVEELTATEPNPQPPPNPAPEDKEPADTPEQDIKDVENPITDRISIPMVNRTAFGIGPFERTANATVIQPVLPIPLGENYVVVRPSLPFVYVPTVSQSQGGNYGLGDVSMQVYFVPKPTGKLTWGFGPTFLFPTASDRTLGFGKWGIGPAAVAVWQGKRLTVGGQIRNYWSVAGDGKRANVSQLTVTPLVTYILGDGWYLVSAPVIAAFWNVPQGGKWLVPIGGGVGKVIKLGDRPTSISVQAYWHAVRPGNSEGWALVVQFNSLFPRK